MGCKKGIQVALNGILTLPDQLPDIDFILRVTSTPIIDTATVIDKQISFSGYVVICLETVSAKKDCLETVHFISFETPFIGLIDHYYARSGMDVQLNASIKHQEFKVVGNKCVSYLIVVKVCVLRLAKSCIPANTHCSEPYLTLLGKPKHRSAYSSTQPSATTPIHPTDYDSEPSEPVGYYLPQTLQEYSVENAENTSCSICGAKINDT